MGCRRPRVEVPQPEASPSGTRWRADRALARIDAAARAQWPGVPAVPPALRRSLRQGPARRRDLLRWWSADARGLPGREDSGAATVFSLHNLRYQDPATFTDVDSVLVASRFAAEHYRVALGLGCTVLPNLVDFPRVRAPDRQPTYAVFVNSTVEKGVAVFARIADELGRRRPDIPFLVVEAKGTEADVAACGLDLRVHGNVFFHGHTNDPRRFWRIARICLLPSLVAENQPLVAIEAMINGVPVIGSNRGGIPETLGRAGLIIPVPDRLSPASLIVPTAEETSPWVEAILSLWDSSEIYAGQSRLALTEANRWAPETLEPLYERFFATVMPGHSPSGAGPSDP